MILDIAVSVIAFAFVLFVLFFLIFLASLRKTVKKVNRVLCDLHHILDKLSKTGPQWVDHMDRLTRDISRKSEALDPLFRPLYALKEGEGNHTLTECLELISRGICLIKKLKSEIKEYVK